MKTFAKILAITFLVSLLVSSFTQAFEGEKGDVNNDGTINILDAMSVVNHVLETDTLDDQESWRADCSSSLGRCDGDSVVNILDVIKIVNIVLEVDLCPIADIDGNTYQVIKIGNQWWMAENLKVTSYCNGDSIPNVTDNTEWAGLSTGAYCDYDNDTDNVPTYGRLYNWYAVNDSRGIAPEGWHIPNDEEWKQLEMFLGMSQSEADDTQWRGTDEGGKLKATGTIEEGTGLWHMPNVGATNESGFSALPGGYRSSYNGGFYPLGSRAYFWLSTEGDSYRACLRSLDSGDAQVGRLYLNKPCGYSVRCVRD